MGVPWISSSEAGCGGVADETFLNEVVQKAFGRRKRFVEDAWSDGERVVCFDRDALICLSKEDGSELWKVTGSTRRGDRTLILIDGFGG